MFKGLLNLKWEHQVFALICIALILIAIFWPRQTPIFSTGVSAHVGNIRGKVQLEAMGSPIEEFSGGEKTLALFYAPWCGHCQRLEPKWEQASSQNATDIKMIKINYDEHPEMAKKFDVKGFPTIYFLPYGIDNPKQRVNYDGERETSALLAFIADK